MAKEKIKLTKTIYSTKSANGLVDRSFSQKKYANYRWF